ncbi:hypothetical protein N1851_024112 [Merluccius polli]|uniref:Uncharacterized protein n=1 Tax=Merluccius polli TaxID=89951 RepID=A0AA47MFN1_MERPO|nr:hypothetical protein N1851_024112 [Merluccius polli]
MANLDPTLSFLPHVNHITKTAFFHLRNIARLRPNLSTTAAETLIYAFTSSRLDYCNILLYGTTTKVLNKLQYVQNLTGTRSREHITPVLRELHLLDYCNSLLYGTTTKVLNKLQYVQNLTGTRSREHITPVLRELHWLPFKHRINFKILLTTYKALNNLARPYHADLLHHHAPSRSLRSISANLLQVPQTKRRTWGDRALSCCRHPLEFTPLPHQSLPNPLFFHTCTQNTPFYTSLPPPNSHLILHV